MDRASDNESDTSFPEVLFGEEITEFYSDDLLKRRRDTEGIMIDQRFYEINRQIGELTNIVSAFTQQVSSITRKGNGLNAVTTSANIRPDRYSAEMGLSRIVPFIKETKRYRLFYPI